MANLLNSLIIEGKIAGINKNKECFDFTIKTEHVVKNNLGVTEIEQYTIPIHFPNISGELFSVGDEVRIVGLLRQNHFYNNTPIVFVQAEHIELKPRKTKGGRK